MKNLSFNFKLGLGLILAGILGLILQDAMFYLLDIAHSHGTILLYNGYVFAVMSFGFYKLIVSQM